MIVVIKQLTVNDVLFDPSGLFGFLPIRGFRFHRNVVATWEDGDYDPIILTVIDIIADKHDLNKLIAVHLSQRRVVSVLWALEIPEWAVNAFEGDAECFDARNYHTREQP